MKSAKVEKAKESTTKEHLKAGHQRPKDQHLPVERELHQADHTHTKDSKAQEARHKKRTPQALRDADESYQQNKLHGTPTQKAVSHKASIGDEKHR